MNNKDNILECVKNCKGYDIALFTTFNFEISFFERFIKNTLFSNGVKKISVFVDAQELNKSLNHEKNSMNIGRHYYVSPIEMQGSFHPKVVLFIGKKRSKVIVSSCNLTTSGYCINNEAFKYYELDEQNTDHKQLFIDVIDFFMELSKITTVADKETLLEVNRYKEKIRAYPNSDTKVRFIHNISTPIFETLKSNVTDIEIIKIAVPYFDNFSYALRQLKSSFNDAIFTLYLQHRKARINTDYEINDSRVYCAPFEGFLDRKNNNFYHGKVFGFYGTDANYALFGSANCTSSALVKTYKTGGNIEADILEETDQKSITEYFENFKCSDIPSPEYQLINDRTQDRGYNFFFRHGNLIKDGISLVLGFIDKCNFKVVYNNNEYEHSSDENNIQVIIPREYINENISISLEVIYGDQKDILFCWYVNPMEIQFTRNSEIRVDDLPDCGCEYENTNYIEDQIKICNALALTAEEYSLNKSVSNSIVRENNLFNEDEAEETADGEDIWGVIDYETPDVDYVFFENRQKKLAGIKSYSANHFWSFAHGENNRTTGKASAAITGKRRSNKPTTEEKKFRRFIINRLKGFVELDFVDVVDYKHYIESAIVFLRIFEKYTIHERVNGLFDDYTIANYRLKIVENILLVYRPDCTESFDEIIDLSLNCFLMNKFYVNTNSTTQHELFCKEQELLKEISRIKNVRKESNMIAALIATNINVDPSAASSFVDDLFGYIPIDRINDLMHKEFSSVIVKVDESRGDEVTITLKVESIRNYIAYRDSRTIKRLIEYNAVKKRWKSINLNVYLIDTCIDKKAPDPLVEVKYAYAVDRKRFTCIKKWKSGKTEPDNNYKMFSY